MRWVSVNSHQTKLAKINNFLICGPHKITGANSPKGINTIMVAQCFFYFFWCFLLYEIYTLKVFIHSIKNWVFHTTKCRSNTFQHTYFCNFAHTYTWTKAREFGDWILKYFLFNLCLLKKYVVVSIRSI